MNKDSWIALIIASIITIIAATPIYYSRDYASVPKGKISEESDTKMTEPMERTEGNTELTTPALEDSDTKMTEPMKKTEGNTEPTTPALENSDTKMTEPR